MQKIKGELLGAHLVAGEIITRKRTKVVRLQRGFTASCGFLSWLRSFDGGARGFVVYLTPQASKSTTVLEAQVGFGHGTMRSVA